MGEADRTLVQLLSGDDAAPVSTAPDVIAGRYQVLSLLGSGSMGAVYRVRDLELDEIVALKVIHAERVALSTALRQEVKLARLVTHPNVVRTFDLGDDGGRRFLTMEYVAGRSLGRRLADERALPPAEVVRIGCAVAAGIGAAHAAGVLHRDLKPDNVLLGDLGRVAISDFGIALLRSDAGGGTLAGSPTYMSPEQVLQEPLDARSDVYSLGAIVYEMVTGARAWPGKNPHDVARARLVADPPAAPPGAHPGLVAVARRCMARDRSDRYDSAEATAAALREAGVGEGTGVVVVPALPTAGRRSVGVLSFRNAGPDDDDWVAEAIGEELVDALASSRGLRVRDATAVVADDPLVSGRQLGVDAVVVGSVRRVGDELRISARVLGVADGIVVWAQRFQGPVSDALRLGDALARAVAQALAVEVSGSGPSPAAEAVELYLKARVMLKQRWNDDPGAVLPLLDKALSLSPDDPAVLSLVAIATARRSFWRYSAEGLAVARAHVARALAVAPDRPEPHYADAMVGLQSSDPVAAARAFRRVLAKAPGHAAAHGYLGGMLLECTALDEGMAHLEVALTLEPEDFVIRADLARGYAYRGDYGRAFEVLDQPTHNDGELVTRSTQVARLSLWARRSIPASLWEDLVARGLDRFPPAQLVRFVHQLGMDPDWKGDDAFLGLVDSGLRGVGPRLAAVAYQSVAEASCRIGDLDRARHALGRAVDSGLFDLSWIERCPVIAPLRGTADFAPAAAVVADRAKAVWDAARVR